jgi:hypothetical protein
MPSDEILDAVRNALAAPTERFQSALATAVEQVRTYLAVHRPHVGTQDANGRAALGSFAAGRIDAARFAALLSEEPRVDVETLARVERAFDALLGMQRRGDELTRVVVEPGSGLAATVGRALFGIGHAFGAARVAELARTGRYSDESHGSLLDSLPYARWSPAERELAPPLIVRVDGGDVLAGGLTEFLDGGLKIVLVIDGASPPAPLVRLITPGTFVLQTADGSGLDRLAGWSGPGVAAVVPEGAAIFVHDPAGGADLRDRLEVTHLPAEDPTAAVGRISATQQAEDLRQLRTLAKRPAAPPAAAPGTAGPAGAADPVDKLAAWLLAQAELPGAG